MKIMIAAVLAISIASPALSQSNCALRVVVKKRLTETYGETRQSIGMAGRGQIVEMWANLETGTWTATVTNTAGVTCLVASGKSFEVVTETIPDEPT